MERLKHFSIKLLTACLAGALLLSLTSLIVLNSGLLDRFAKERVLALFNEKFYGRLALQELHLQFPNKVTLINSRIYAPGETAAALEAEKSGDKETAEAILQSPVEVAPVIIPKSVPKVQTSIRTIWAYELVPGKVVPPMYTTPDTVKIGQVNRATEGKAFSGQDWIRCYPKKV